MIPQQVSFYSCIIPSPDSGLLGLGGRTPKDLEKAASFASGTCGHFGGNSALLIEVGQSRFEDFLKPHQQLIHIFLVILCRESCYFEDIINL